MEEQGLIAFLSRLAGLIKKRKAVLDIFFQGHMAFFDVSHMASPHEESHLHSSVFKDFMLQHFFKVKSQSLRPGFGQESKHGLEI